MNKNQSVAPVKSARTIKESVEYMADYAIKYPLQSHYEKYSPRTYLEDMLYGIGVSMGGEQYEFAGGFDRFKRDLLDYLKATTTEDQPPRTASQGGDQCGT